MPRLDSSMRNLVPVRWIFYAAPSNLREESTTDTTLILKKLVEHFIKCHSIFIRAYPVFLSLRKTSQREMGNPPSMQWWLGGVSIVCTLECRLPRSWRHLISIRPDDKWFPCQAVTDRVMLTLYFLYVPGLNNSRRTLYTMRPFT